MEDFKKLLVRCANEMYERITIGEFEMSIQASYSHYCSPRKTLDNAQDYSAFELAIFENGNWINPINDERFLEIAELLEDRYESGPSAVGAYIPDHIIQKVCDFIESNFGQEE